MVQISVGFEPGGLKAGMKADLCEDTCKSYKNTTGAGLPFGVAVALGAADDRLKRISSTADKFIGVHVFDQVSSTQGLSQTSDPAFGSATLVDYQLPDKKMASVMRIGAVVVDVEGAVAAESAPYIRVTANGVGKDVLGAFRGDSDGGTCVRARGCKFISSTSAAGQALLFLFGDLGFVVTDGPVAAGVAPGHILATVGVEGAIVANAIEVQCSIVDANGVPVTAIRNVHIASTPTVAGTGAITAAGTPVGTGFFAQAPVTGDNNASIISTAGGLFAFRITNTGADVVDVVIEADNCPSRVLRLTFA